MWKVLQSLALLFVGSGIGALLTGAVLVKHDPAYRTAVGLRRNGIPVQRLVDLHYTDVMTDNMVDALKSHTGHDLLATVAEVNQTLAHAEPLVRVLFMNKIQAAVDKDQALGMRLYQAQQILSGTGPPKPPKSDKPNLDDIT